MGMQSASMQQPYSSAPQGKGQGLPNPQAQMSPNQPPMDAREEMIRRFPQPPVQQMDAGPSGVNGLQAPTPNAMPNQMPQGKGQGAQGAITFPGQGGQPAMGQPNAYSNTINPSDNTGMAQNQAMGSGKGGGSAKGAR